MKIQNGVYCCDLLGHNISCLMATAMEGGGAKGGVGIVSIERPDGCIIKTTRFHGPNLVICKLMTVDLRTPVFSAYLPPSMLNHLPYIEESLNCLPDRDTILLGNLNVYIGQIFHHCERQIDNFLASLGLVDMLAHLWQRLQYWDVHTWVQDHQD